MTHNCGENSEKLFAKDNVKQQTNWRP